MKDEERKIMELRNKVRKQTCLCHRVGCIEDAIKSHVLWKSGVVNSMSNSNDVVELLFHLVRKDYEFKKVKSWRSSDTLTFWGFCKKCDNDIFSPIEKKDANYEDYNNQLLMAYRWCVNELYKIEYNLKWYEAIFMDLSITTGTKNLYFRKLLQFLPAIDLFNKSKELFEIELCKVSDEKNFIFLYKEIDRIDICSCAYYNEVDSLPIKSSNDFFNSSIYFSLFPKRGKTILLVWTRVDSKHVNLIERLKYMNDSELLKYISDVLIKRVETWIVSVELFTEWQKKEVDQKILQKIKEYLPFDKKNLETDFNLFNI